MSEQSSESRAAGAMPQRSIERRKLSADRRDKWRGSRRDADWIRHYEEEASSRRAQRRAELGRTLTPRSTLH